MITLVESQNESESKVITEDVDKVDYKGKVSSLYYSNAMQNNYQNLDLINKVLDDNGVSNDRNIIKSLENIPMDIVKSIYDEITKLLDNKKLEESSAVADLVETDTIYSDKKGNKVITGQVSDSVDMVFYWDTNNDIHRATKSDFLSRYSIKSTDKSDYELFESKSTKDDNKEVLEESTSDKEYSKIYSKNGKKYRYNYKSSELEILDPETEEIIDSSGLNSDDFDENPDYWIDHYNDELESEFNEYIDSDEFDELIKIGVADTVRTYGVTEEQVMSIFNKGNVTLGEIDEWLAAGNNIEDFDFNGGNK